MLLAAGPAAPPLGAGVDGLVVQQSVLVASLEPAPGVFASTVKPLESLNIQTQLTQTGSVSSGRI